jgi:hypothetical protein
MFKDLDPILHSQLRLAIVSLLVSVKEAEFTYIKERDISKLKNSLKTIFRSPHAASHPQDSKLLKLM